MKDSRINFLLNRTSGIAVAFDMGDDYDAYSPDRPMLSSIFEVNLANMVIAHVPAELQAARILDHIESRITDAGYTEECAVRNIKRHIPTIVAYVRYLTRKANTYSKLGVNPHNV